GLTFGNGNAVVNLNPTPGAAGPFTVGGDLRIQTGGGNDSITLNGAVAGGLSFNLGNGNDTVTAVNAPAGPLNWVSGNGNDSLTLAPTAVGQTWTVAVRF